jgi:hypothetical protein
MRDMWWMGKHTYLIEAGKEGGKEGMIEEHYC